VQYQFRLAALNLSCAHHHVTKFAFTAGIAIAAIYG